MVRAGREAAHRDCRRCRTRRRSAARGGRHARERHAERLHLGLERHRVAREERPRRTHERHRVPLRNAVLGQRRRCARRVRGRRILRERTYGRGRTGAAVVRENKVRRKAAVRAGGVLCAVHRGVESALRNEPHPPASAAAIAEVRVVKGIDRLAAELPRRLRRRYAVRINVTLSLINKNERARVRRDRAVIARPALLVVRNVEFRLDIFHLARARRVRAVHRPSPAARKHGAIAVLRVQVRRPRDRYEKPQPREENAERRRSGHGRERRRRCPKSHRLRRVLPQKI